VFTVFLCLRRPVLRLGLLPRLRICSWEATRGLQLGRLVNDHGGGHQAKVLEPAK
jgi:hypothetical protein